MTTFSSGEFHKISPTAYLTAYVRQFAEIDYAKEIAESIDSTAIHARFIDEDKNNNVGKFAALIEGRYRAIEQVRSSFSKIQQMLELASGLSPRGMILSNNKEITFVESDLYTMIQQKQELVRNLIGEPPNLHFLAIDATTDLHVSRLKKYFQCDQKIIILSEGLLIYLTFDEKQQVFANVKSILQHFGGVWITPDLTTKVWAKEMKKHEPEFWQFNQEISSSTDRDFQRNAFNDLDHVKQFVEEQGFQIKEFEIKKLDLDQLICLSHFNIDRKVAKNILSNRFVFSLTLA